MAVEEYIIDGLRFIVPAGSLGNRSNNAKDIRLGSDGTWAINKTYAELEALHARGILLKLRWELNGDDHFLPFTRKYEKDGVGYFEFTEVTAQPTEDSVLLVYHRFTLDESDNLVYSTGTTGSAGDDSALREYIDERLDNYDAYTVTIGARKYRAEKIGNTLWLAANLDYQFPGLEMGATDVPVTPAAWYYDNDETQYGLSGSKKCGLLYNWYAAKYLNDNASALLPAGWHVPTNAEWVALISHEDPNEAGKHLKALDGSANGMWPVDWNGRDLHRLAVYPGGLRDAGATFRDAGSEAHLWTADSVLGSNAQHKRLVSSSNSVLTAAYDKAYAMSVRLALTLNADGSIPEGSGVVRAFVTKEYVDAMLGNVESLLSAL